MKERPIIFNSEMVRAILDGRKTHTRRVVKPQPQYPGAAEYCFEKHPYAPSAVKGTPLEDKCNPKDEKNTWLEYDSFENCTGVLGDCPHGQPGDRLWVKETWTFLGIDDADGLESERQIGYKANSVDGYSNVIDPPKWKPSIHMPRWASRINLEITDVRVERVQDINIKQARKEGCHLNSPVLEFQKLWNSINEKRGFGWNKNPWVWVIEFKVIQ